MKCNFRLQKAHCVICDYPYTGYSQGVQARVAEALDPLLACNYGQRNSLPKIVHLFFPFLVVVQNGD